MIQLTLHSHRLTLVPLAEEHLEHEVRLDANPRVMRYLGEGQVRQRDEVEKQHHGRIASARNGLGYWAGFLGDEFVGWWILDQEDNDDRGQAELGYRLLPEFWRSGLASEGGAALLAYGFERLGLERIFAETMTVNAGSQAVMKRLGMTYLRTRGEGESGPIPGTEEGTVDYTITAEQWASRGGTQTPVKGAVPPHAGSADPS